MLRVFTFLLLACSLNLTAQTIIAQENFTNYDGTVTTVPTHWYFTYHGNYITTVSSGASGPNSYKFGINNATIIAPKFNQADSVKFWIKGSGVDTLSKLIIFESADSITWDTLAKFDHLPTTAATGKRSCAVKSTSKFLKFKYVKSAGNLAFDDFKLLLNASNVNFSATNVAGCVPFCTVFSTTSITPIKTYQWNLGVGNSSIAQPTQCYSLPGTYTISLTVVDSLDNTYTLSKPNYMNVSPLPVAEFTTPVSAQVNTVVNFTDASTGVSSWLWDFSDPNDNVGSTLQNPTHTFTDTGTYCPVLIAYTNQGCSDTVKHCLHIDSFLTSLNALSKNELHFTVAQNDNSLQLNFSKPLNNSVQMNMYNTLGVLIHKLVIETASHYCIPIENLTPGIYYLNIFSQAFNETKRIIITK